MAASTRDAQHALENLTGRLTVSRSSGRPFGPVPATGVGVTWEVPSETGHGVEQYPHATGPNPHAPAGSIGRDHHITTTRGVTPAEQAFSHTERDPGGVSTPVMGPSPWRIVERVHHRVTPGGGMGPAVHDQHMAINMIPNADGTHDVRSATVTAATHHTPGSVVIRTGAAREGTVSRATARR